MDFEVFDFESIARDGILVPYALVYSDSNKVYYIKVEDQSAENACLLILQQFKSGTYYAHHLLFDFALIIRGLLRLNVRYT
jgi:hypothetical protein